MFTLTHGCRLLNVAQPPPPPPQEGIILPPARPTNHAAGRIFLIFVDDFHLDFRNTGRIRELFKRITKELIHEGDMFGIVSTGPSSLSIDPTYDLKRLDQAINKITGSGLAPKDILDVPEGAQGPPEVRYRAHVAFSTANDIIATSRRFTTAGKPSSTSSTDTTSIRSRSRGRSRSRKGTRMQPSDYGDGSNGRSGTRSGPTSSNEFYQADLVSELSWLTRAANGANVTMYTIDPRGLVGMPDLDEKIDMVEWQAYVRTSQDSLGRLPSSPVAMPR